ncbi:phospholipase D-like domain-containing protein [Flavobacterium sp.]|uniref:phospholipase D-like domain-containing protein n=1 Tax=Flavobacterium sp. TaxID=239 RepID=UPI002B4B7B0B|nr:phospholipase D-like domain-containing protein [Flavobacterium sp.]HLP65493.1 phospholipase D-like domain-containing protein [Flavobacterium sp.]
MNEILTNGTEIKQRILSEIKKAQKSVYLAMAFFTDRDIANEIIEAKKRNITVDIILSSNAQNETVKLMFKEAYISVHAFNTGDERGMMHHKFCLIDEKISINGSYNYSYNASNNNVENIHVSDSLDVYRQLFTEFERLKYNIDHELDINSSLQTQKIAPLELPKVNMIDTFYQQLHNLVYSSAQINAEEYKSKGYQASKDRRGSIDIFKMEYENIKEEIKAYATDENLSYKKTIITSNITNAFESAKINLETDKQTQLNNLKEDNEIIKRQLNDKISDINREKSLLESGNQNSGEKGLLQINREIEKIQLEKKSIEQSLIVKKFWTAGTILALIGLCIFTFYLSIFFASAVYKVFFESNEIRNSLEAGINPGLPQLVDANAAIKIFRKQGSLFGIIALLFFLIPLMLSNLKLLGSKNKFVNKLMFWVGLMVFDVVVSIMVALNTSEIKSLLNGENSQLQIWEVFGKGEFWLIFVFGMFPLIITHYLIENIVHTYSNSKRELVDAEKNKSLQVLDEQMIELNYEKEKINNSIQEKEALIKVNNEKIQKLELDTNDEQRRIESLFDVLQKQIKSIFDDFNSKIISGKIFTDVILDNVISSYKLGFIEYLPEYYATEEVANRVKEIEQIITT